MACIHAIAKSPAILNASRRLLVIMAVSRGAGVFLTLTSSDARATTGTTIRSGGSLPAAEAFLLAWFANWMNWRPSSS